MRAIRVAVAAFVFLLLARSPAQAGFDLGLAANYVVLTDPRVNSVQFTSDTHITGNVGVSKTATNTSPQVQGAGVTITGNLDFAGPINVTNTTVTGSTTANVTNVTTAYNTLTSLSSTLGAEAGTSLNALNFSNPQTINASSGILDANGNEVFQVTSGGSFSVSGGLTINGTASQYVVINIASGVTAAFKSGINLTGGITPDHILYNILGTGNEVKGGAGKTVPVYGTILAVDRKFNMDNVLVLGRVFGGGNNDFQLVSNFNIVDPITIEVPEPATITLWSFLGIIGGVAGWRKKLRAA